jgi:hypothetical protein
MTYAELVSTVALASSLFGLWLHWARHQRERADREPEVTTKRWEARGLPGWSTVEITVRNRDDLKLTVDHLTVLWPPLGKVGTLRAGMSQQPESWQLPLHPPTDRARTINPQIALDQAGQARQFMSITGIQISPGDTHSASFLVSVKPSSTLRLRISASWSRRSLKPWSSIISVQTISATPTNSTQ